MLPGGLNRKFVVHCEYCPNDKNSDHLFHRAIRLNDVSTVSSSSSLEDLQEATSLSSYNF